MRCLQDVLGNESYGCALMMGNAAPCMPGAAEGQQGLEAFGASLWDLLAAFLWGS